LASSLPRLDVANATFITSQLLLGGDLEVFDHELATAQLRELVAVGVTDIVDLRLEWSDAAWVADQMPQLRYQHLGVDDAGQRMPDAWFDTAGAHTWSGISMRRSAMSSGRLNPTEYDRRWDSNQARKPCVPPAESARTSTLGPGRMPGR
jgi:hypothetical protein